MATRITGLATGLDIDSIVKTTMKAYQTKIDTQIQKKDVLEIKQRLYRDLVQESQDFFNKYLDSTSKDCLRKSANYTGVKFAATNANGTTSNAVSVKGLSGAEATNYSVQVAKLATSAKYTIQKGALDGVSAIRINGKKIDISGAANDAEIVDKINAGLKANGITNIKAKYSDFSKGIVIEDKNTGRSSEFTLGILDSSDKNTVSQSSSVKNGINGTAAYVSYTIDDLRALSEIKIGDVKIDLTAINNNHDLTATGKEVDYLNAVKKAIDDGGVDTAYAGVNADDKKLTFTAKEIGSGVKFSVNGTDISNGTDNQPASMEFSASQLSGMDEITINGVKVTLTAGKTLEEYKTDINNALQKPGYEEICGNVTAKIEGDKLVLNTADKGSGSSIAVTGKKDGNIVFPTQNSGEDITVQGENSLAFITDPNGNVYTAASNKNTVIVDNTQFTFNSTTYNQATNDYDTITITGTKDATELKDKLVKFIDDYNKLITNLNKAIMTKHNRNYSPLTADQKKAMSESEVKLWNEKVEEGQLYRDSDLSRISNALKATMRSVMKESGLSLEKIGITPVKDYSGIKNGTFTIDEDVLKEAIEENSEDVMKLFMGGSITNVTPGDGKTGILNQLYYTLNKEMFGSFSSLSKKVGFEGTSTFTNNTITNNISNYEKKIKDMQTQYSRKEQALYSKYSTLESAMNKYNSQLAYLTSAFSS